MNEPMLLGRTISPLSEWMYYFTLRGSSLKIIAKFATFKVDDFIFRTFSDILVFTLFTIFKWTDSWSRNRFKSCHSLTAVNQPKIFKVHGEIKKYLDFFRLFWKMQKPEKTQENRRDCLNETNLKISLHFWKKSATFLRFTAQLENPKKIELFYVFWWFKKVKSWILGFLCFLSLEFCKKVELPEPTTD